MSKHTMPTAAVLCRVESPVLSAAVGYEPDAVTTTFWRLVAPMTSELGSGLFGSGRNGTALFASTGFAGADLVPTITAPFAATRPSTVVPPMTQAPRDARVDARVAVLAAKQARPPRGVPR